jgi:hypothetical protein
MLAQPPGPGFTRFGWKTENPTVRFGAWRRFEMQERRSSVSREQGNRAMREGLPTVATFLLMTLVTADPRGAALSWCRSAGSSRSTPQRSVTSENPDVGISADGSFVGYWVARDRRSAL